MIKAHEGSSLGMHRARSTNGLGLPFSSQLTTSQQLLTSGLPYRGLALWGAQIEEHGRRTLMDRRPGQQGVPSAGFWASSETGKECQELDLGRTRTASRGGVTQSRSAQDEGQVALVTKGDKRKRTAAATKREQRTKQTTEALAWDSPERPACLHKTARVHRRRTSRRTLWTWASHLGWGT